MKVSKELSDDMSYTLDDREIIRDLSKYFD